MELSRDYIAGIMDGEGCIGISRSNGKGRSFNVRVTICMKNRTLVTLIATQLQGHIHRGSEGRTTAFWNGDDAVRVIEYLLPVLVIKKETAEHVLEFRRLQKYYYQHRIPTGKSGPPAYSTDQIGHLESLCQTVSEVVQKAYH